MTIKELSQYHNVKIEIQQIKDNIEEIETTIIGSSKITGMPMAYILLSLLFFLKSSLKHLDLDCQDILDT